ncbi:MAG: gluconokinase [Chloroflexota bacterium]
MSTISIQQAQAPYILTFDVGSSSIRTMVFDSQGRSLTDALTQHPITLTSTTDGGSFADPQQLFDLLGACLDETLAKMGSFANQITGVASCTFVGNGCGVNKQGQVIIPLLTYADTRSAAEVEQLKGLVDEAITYQRTGCRIHPSYLPTQLRWLAQAQSEAFEQVVYWLSFGEYVAWQLFGERRVSHSVASWSGLLNRHTLTWDNELLNHLPLTRNQLSPLSNFDQPMQGLRPEFAARWPALKDIPWFPTIGDGAAANIGSGCVNEGNVALTIGTTSALRVVIEGRNPTIPTGLWCYRVDQKRALLGGALSEGGGLITWLQTTLNLNDTHTLNQQVADLPPDQHGLTLLPFWAGERSPGWQGDARGTIEGLSLSTTPEQMLQAGMEAVAYRLALVFDLLSGELENPPQLITSGGALYHWPIWGQIIADVLGQPLLVSNVEEASARGIALLAFEALNGRNLTDFSPQIIDTYTPRQAHFDRYRQALARQKRLYTKVLESN